MAKNIHTNAQSNCFEPQNLKNQMASKASIFSSDVKEGEVSFDSDDEKDVPKVIVDPTDGKAESEAGKDQRNNSWKKS